MHDDDIDALLTLSDPASDLTTRERTQIALMVERSAPTARRRRHVRPVAVATIAAALLGGGGMAAAAATGLWDAWAQEDPLAVLHYELPSGATCEQRIGNVKGAPEEVQDVIREALAGAVFDHTDVAEGAAYAGEAGDVSTDDDAYQTGYNWAITLRMEAALEAHNLDGKWASIDSQGVCE